MVYGRWSMVDLREVVAAVHQPASCIGHSDADCQQT